MSIGKIVDNVDSFLHHVFQSFDGVAYPSIGHAF
jgi:hypothetical protein